MRHRSVLRRNPGGLLLALLLLACPSPPGNGENSPSPIPTMDPALCGNGELDPLEGCDEGDENGNLGACGCQENCQYSGGETPCEDGLACTVDDVCNGLGACEAGVVDCEDEDPCTEDRCEADGCHNEVWDGGPLDLWDQNQMRDVASLDLRVLGSTQVLEGLTLIEVRELRYRSWEWEDCEQRAIDIEAWLAIPVSALGQSSSLPGMVKAHGLGGSADAGAASTPAAELGAVVLAYSGPGQGNSEGWGSTPDHLFDTVPDPRNSWFWEHPAAAMRALTVLEQIDEVDPARLGMMGYSGGSVATLTVAGVDNQIQAAVAVSGTGHMDLAVDASPVPGWQANLLAAMSSPRNSSDDEWLNFERWLDPKHFGASAQANLMIINGAQDEFFPVNTTAATFAGLAPTGQHRLLVVKNWDHGPFALLYPEGADRVRESHNYWLQNRFGLEPILAELAPMPQVDSIVPWQCWDPGIPLLWDCALVTASVAVPNDLVVLGAEFHWSLDGALFFGSWNLQEQAPGVWAAEVGALDGSVFGATNLVQFVTFEFGSDIFGLGPRFQLSSRPHIPPGFVPNITPMQ